MENKGYMRGAIEIEIEKIIEVAQVLVCMDITTFTRHKVLMI